MTEPRKRFALFSLLAGLALGVVWLVMFWESDPGVNVPLYFALLTAVILITARLARTRIHWRNLWVLIPMLFFALMIAVRDGALLMLVNAGAALALGTLAAHYLPRRQPLDTEPLGAYTGAVMVTSVSISVYPAAEAVDALSEVRRLFDQVRGSARAVARGLIVAVPVIIVFGALFAAADAVFASYFDGLADLIRLPQSFVTQVFFAGAVGYFVCGTLAYTVARRTPVNPPVKRTPTPESQSYDPFDDVPLENLLDAPPARKPKGWTLGMIEAAIVLLGVNALFAIFVLIQFTYFFGGTVNLTSLTYAEYARRGFFELLAVSVMTLGLALWLDFVTVRANPRQHRLFRALCVLLVAFTGVILISAVQRMLLYEEAYGFTHLRVLTHVFMIWLAVIFGFYLLSLFRVREQIFALGVVLCCIGYLGTLNLMNVDLYIAERNIARFAEGEELDTSYLRHLSSDAVPAVIALFERSPEDSDARYDAGQWLVWQQRRLTRFETPLTAFFSYHIGIEAARAAIASIADKLPEYNPYWSGSYLSGR
jgi:hypothetical protein